MLPAGRGRLARLEVPLVLDDGGQRDRLRPVVAHQLLSVVPARVEAAAAEPLVLMNEVIPRPALGGVTTADVRHGSKEVKDREIENYRQQEAAREVRAWTRSYWQILEARLAVGRMSSEELLTKLALFHRPPLRRIAQRNRERVG